MRKCTRLIWAPDANNALFTPGVEMKKRKSKVGGAREGAGRKAIYGERKVTTSARLTPTIREFAADLGLSVEDVMRQHPRFRKWIKARGNDAK